MRSRRIERGLLLVCVNAPYVLMVAVMGALWLWAVSSTVGEIRIIVEGGGVVISGGVGGGLVLAVGVATVISVPVATWADRRLRAPTAAEGTRSDVLGGDARKLMEVR